MTRGDVATVAGTLADLVDHFDQITFKGDAGSVTVTFDRHAPMIKRLRQLARLTGRTGL